MCGIAGYWNAGGLMSDAGWKLEKMTKTLYHRVPVGYGFHVDNEKGLAMGHARLSFIVLLTGSQTLDNLD